MKINFTKEHYQKMCALLLDMLMNNGTIQTKLGQQLNVVELLHCTTINSLNEIRLSLTNVVRKIEDQDEWVEDNHSERLDSLKAKKELVNLIIGYKRWSTEVRENQAKREALKLKIAQMKEAAKTPEDRLKEAEAELAALESEENF